MIWGNIKEVQARHERVFCWLPVHLQDGRWLWLEEAWREDIEGWGFYHAVRVSDPSCPLKTSQ